METKPNATLSTLWAYLRKIWFLSLFALSLALFLFNTALPSSEKITHGFAAYYTASRLALEHRAGPSLYDDNFFRSEVEQMTDDQASDIYWANPPTTVLLFLSIASKSPEEARRWWIVVSILCCVLVILLFGKIIPGNSFPHEVFYLTASAFLLSAPLADNFKYGQVYLFLLGLYASALYAQRIQLDWLAGICLATTLMLKASGIPLLLLLLFHGQWRLLMWTLFGAVACAFLSLPLIGVPAWEMYLFHVIPNFVSDPVIAVTAYQTIPGLFRHLFTYSASWNPAPLFNWPVFASLAGWMISLALASTAVLRGKRSSIEWTFCVGLLLSVILAPVAEQHHYVLLFPAFLYGAVSLKSTRRLLLLVAAFLVAFPLIYAAPALSSGWCALLAYPRLYGALLLFVILPNPSTDE